MSTNSKDTKNAEKYMTSFGIYKWQSEKPIRILQIFNSYNFSIFTRSSVSNLCSSMTRYLVKSSPPGTQKNIICTEQMDYSYFTNNHKIFINTNEKGISYVLLTTANYPNRLLLSIIMDTEKELQKYNDIINCTHSDLDIKLHTIEESITKNSLLNNDKISQIQDNLHDTKEIMVENISNILKNGEKLETLIDKSEELENLARNFNRGSAKLNSCCFIL